MNLRPRGREPGQGTDHCVSAAGFLARPAFFASLAFFPTLRFGFAASGSGVAFTASIAFSLIGFSLTGLRSSHGSLRLGETSS